MDIYLIRHTQTANTDGLCYGQTDVDLADSFTDEVDILHSKLPEFSEECLVFTSPLSRCIQLAETFADQVKTDTRIQELYFGDWENKLFNDIEPTALQHWTTHFATAAPPNGETFTQLYQRASEFWQHVLQQQTEQIIIVTHAGVIRALLANVLSLPPANAFQFRIDAGSVHKLRVIDNYIYVEYINL